MSDQTIVNPARGKAHAPAARDVPSYNDSDIVVTSHRIRAVVPDILPEGATLTDSHPVHGFVASAVRGLVMQQIASSRRAHLEKMRKDGKSVAECAEDLQTYVPAYRFEQPRSKGSTVGVLRRKLAGEYLIGKGYIKTTDGRPWPSDQEVPGEYVDKVLASPKHSTAIAVMLHTYLTSEAPEAAKAEKGEAPKAALDLD